MTERKSQSLFERSILVPALIDSFRKLDPRVQIRNPVMFVVEIGAADHHRGLAHPAVRRAVRSAAATSLRGSPSPSRSGCG